MQSTRAHSIRIHLIAATLIRWGLERLVQSVHPQFEIVGGASDIAQCVSLLERQPADVVLVVMDGAPVEELGELCAKASAKVLLVTNSADHQWLDSAVMAGVRGVVRTCEPPAALLKALEKVHEGELWIDRSATSRIFMEMARRKAADRDDPEQSKLATLTSRERQTIVAVASDASAPGKVIADRLCISEHTLRNHLTSIYSKLGLSNRVDLYAFATRHALHQPR